MRWRAVALGWVLVAALVAPNGVGAAPPSEGGWQHQWGMELIGAEAAWNAGLLGEGVDIAVIDTGVHLSHQDFSGRISAGHNFVEPGRPPQDNYHDPYGQPRGHGTHVTGIAAAGYGNGGVVGVAPLARIMPLKVLDRDGNGSSSNVAAAMRWAADNGAEVINLSLGSFGQALYGPSTQEAIRYVWERGAIAVFAAGNDFVLPSGFRDEPAIVVSSVSRHDNKSYFSSTVENAMWAIAAPGGADSLASPEEDRVFSTLWVDDDRTDTYGYMQGTSMAAPHVAGAAAVLRAAGLSPQETVDRLLATAKDLGPEGPDATYGSGRLDVARAVEGVRASGGDPPPSPGPTSPPPTPAPTTAPPGPTAPPRDTTSSPPQATEAPTSSPTTTTTTTAAAPPSTDGDATAGSTMAIQTEGEPGGGRPWLPIALATAAFGAAAGGLAVTRRRTPTQ